MFPVKLIRSVTPQVVVFMTLTLFSALAATNSRSDNANPAGVVCNVPGGYSTIQAAVDDNHCAIIALTTGLYVENVVITRTVTIQGRSPADTTVDGNASGPVFAIGNGGVVTLTRMTITHGLGGIYNAAGTFEAKVAYVIDCAIRNNAGSGIVNVASRFGDAWMYVTRTTLSGNAATTGGGIDNGGYASLYVTNSTLSNNSAGRGGGIYNSGGAVEITNSTLSNNSASQGGGIYNVWYEAAPYGGYEYLGATNSIVAHSASGGDCVNAVDARFSDKGYNMVEDGTCLSASTSISGDPQLGPLADNWGFTPTQTLLKGSPAIDAGSENCLSTDQRGISRPLDGNGDGLARCDIGAFELLMVKSSTFLPLMAR